LHCAFADECYGDAAEAGKHEGAAPDSVDEEGGEDVAGKGQGNPERAEEEGQEGFHAEGGIEENSIVCNDKDSLRN